MRWIKSRFWDMSEGVRDLRYGGFTVHPKYPLPRRAAQWAKQHWLAHWQWWIGTTLALVAVYRGIS